MPSSLNDESQTPNEFDFHVQSIQDNGLRQIREAASLRELENVRTKLLGRSQGELTRYMGWLPRLRADLRAPRGQLINDTKRKLEDAIASRRAELASQEQVTVAPLDLTMPERDTWEGGLHPVTQVIEEITEIFRKIGFTVALGPEVESEWYNFGALNFPAEHPALDAHDTLYLERDILLRTHTSPVQIRTLQRYPPPIRILAPGNVYRRDAFDASHAPMFAQIEGLAVDEGVSFVDLKATLTHFARQFFGTTATRFRPSYFPFTEPSAEMDVECQICHGAGCPTCKQTGWTEILGCGMVHPAVLEAAGVDSERYTGWAFGMGPARIAQQRYDIPDIRVLYDGDIGVLAPLST